jgi:hypothetical protein
MTVYVVTSGCYSDYGINAIFSTQEKAQEYMEAFPRDEYNPILEIDLDPEHAAHKKAGRTLYRVGIDREGNVEWCEAIQPHKRTVQPYIWRRSRSPVFVGKCDLLTGWFWAEDKRHAVKIANEHRVQMIALGRWPEPE